MLKQSAIQGTRHLAKSHDSTKLTLKKTEVIWLQTNKIPGLREK